MKTRKNTKLDDEIKALEEVDAKLRDELEIERSQALSEEDGNVSEILEEKRLNSIILKKKRDQINTMNQMNIKKNSDRIGIGSKVSLENHINNLNIEIVPKEDSSPIDGKISDVSPLGKILLNKKAGEKIKLKLPNKELVEYKIRSIN